MPGTADTAPDFPAAALTDDLAPDWGVFIRPSRSLAHLRSPFQAIEVHDTASFGKLFRLDGHFMTSEKDEFFYHENLVHMAALSHPGPRDALIIGGGDGGSAEELLKHPSIASVTVCEIDSAVVDIAREHLQSVHRGALDHPRVTLKIGDGFAFLRQTGARYDLIVLDLTDPGGASLPLYTAAFYRSCAVRLRPSGALTLHVGSPVAHGGRIRDVLSRLREAFPRVTPYLTSVPLYGGLWMMACASATLDPCALTALEIDRRIAERGLGDLRCYNGDMHRAALAMPNFVRALVAP